MSDNSIIVVLFSFILIAISLYRMYQLRNACSNIWGKHPKVRFTDMEERKLREYGWVQYTDEYGDTIWHITYDDMIWTLTGDAYWTLSCKYGNRKRLFKRNYVSSESVIKEALTVKQHMYKTIYCL